MKKARTQKPRVVAVAAGAAPAAPADALAWRVGIVAVFGLIAIFAARHLADADLGYHLRGGQWILENHRFPSKDTYTYTRADADYPDLHWLYQVLIYGTYAVGDYVSLSVSTARTRFKRSSNSNTERPLASGVAAPIRPVLPP